MAERSRGHGRRWATVAVALTVTTASGLLLARTFVERGSGAPPPSVSAPEPPPVESTPGPDPTLEATPPRPVKATLDITLPIEWPVSIAYGEGSIWVAASANDGTGSGTVHRIEPDSGRVQAVIPVKAVPGWDSGGGSMEVNDGSVWVAGGGSTRRLSRIGTATNRVTQEMAIQGRFLGDVAVHDGDVWASVFVRRTTDPWSGGIDLVRLDPASGLETARIPLDAEYGRDVLASGGSIWVHLRETRQSVVGASVLARADPATGRIVDSVSVGSPATSLTQTEDAIWITTWRSGEGNLLMRLDPHSGEVETLPAGTLETLVTPGAGGLWGRGRDVEGRRTGVVRFDPVSAQVDTSLPLPRGLAPFALAVAPSSVWITQYEEGVTRIDLRPA
jgi:hypothetical protein